MRKLGSSAAGGHTVCFQRLGFDFRLVLEIVVEDTDVLPLEPVKVSLGSSHRRHRGAQRVQVSSREPPRHLTAHIKPDAHPHMLRQVHLRFVRLYFFVAIQLIPTRAFFCPE